MLDNIFSRFGVSTTYIDGTAIAHFEAARRPETTLIYLESPNSWSFAIQDLAAVAAFASTERPRYSTSNFGGADILVCLVCNAARSKQTGMSAPL